MEYPISLEKGAAKLRSASKSARTQGSGTGPGVGRHHHHHHRKRKQQQHHQQVYNRRQQYPTNKCVCMPIAPSTFEFPRIWKELLTKNQLCDGMVRCIDGTEFRIHRAILSAASPYFRALFTNSINRDKSETFEANVAASGKIFSLFLDYAYTGTCKVQTSNVENLLKFADQYEVLGVVQICCNFLFEELCPANCLGILNFANQYFCNDLVRKGRNFVRSAFAKVANESSEFVHMPKSELIDYIQDDELNVKTEEIVFEAIVKWVDYMPNMRHEHLPELLKFVRFGSLTKECIANIANHPLVAENRKCLELVNSFYESSDQVPTDLASCDTSFRPRVSFDILFAVGGWSAGSPTNFVETYDVRSDKWLLSADTDSTPRAYHGLCSMGGYIYVIGGFDGSHYFNNVRKFDPVHHKWIECACMYFHRCYVSVVVVQNKIYAMGGYNGRNRMNTCERFDSTRNQWELVASMQKQRSDASAAALNDKIYIVGGFNGQQVMRSAEMFDIRTNQWTYIPQMLSARSGVSLVAHENTLYALGGFNGYVRLTTGEKFVPGESLWWSEIPEMLTPRSNFATAILDDFIYVIGGFNDNFVAGSSTINYVEYYDPDSEEWYDASPMNLNRSALSACVISGLPNAKEYSILGRNNAEFVSG